MRSKNFSLCFAENIYKFMILRGNIKKDQKPLQVLQSWLEYLKSKGRVETY